MPPKRKDKSGPSAAELIAKKRQVYVPPVWTSSRPKPEMDPNAGWPPEEADAVARYIDWHGRHPHMVSPRKPEKESLEKKTNVRTDEDNPDLVYYANGMYSRPPPADLTPSVLGANGQFRDTAIIATVYERQANIAGGIESNDPHYTMSVKDNLEQYHIDGDSTTVKTKPKPKIKLSASQQEFEKDRLWQEQQYSAYEGGGPAFDGEKRVILEALTLATAQAARSDRTKVGPWEDSDRRVTRFTADGHNLDEYRKEELERRIERALETHRLMSAQAADETKRQLRVAKAVAKEKANAAGDAGFSSKSNHSDGSQGNNDNSVSNTHTNSIANNNNSISGSISSNNSTSSSSLRGLGAGLRSLFGGGDASILPEGSIASLAGTASSSSLASSIARSLTRSLFRGDTGSNAGSKPGTDTGAVEGTVGGVVSTSKASRGSKSKGAKGTKTRGSRGEGDTLSATASMSYTLSLQNSHPDADADADADNDFVGDIPDDTSALTNVTGLEDGTHFSLATNNDNQDDDFSIASNDDDPNTNSNSNDNMDGNKKKAKHKKSKRIAISNIDISLIEDMQKHLHTIDEDDSLAAGNGSPGAMGINSNLTPEELEIEREKERERQRDAQLGKYELMLKRIGGEEECQKRAIEWIKLAEVVRRKAKRQHNMFDLSADLYDSCNNGDLVKVLFCLGVQGLDVNIKTPDDELLLIHMLMKILAMDNVTDSLHDSSSESTDRVRLMRVVMALLRFGADLTTVESRAGQPPLHLATLENNSKMVTFLLERGCDPAKMDRVLDPVTPLMIAAKYGYVKIIAALLRRGANVDQVDFHGRTALHHAGMWGQTRTALFLLQCGANKRLIDKQRLTPGALSELSGYIVTGQAILTFSNLELKNLDLLSFYANDFKRRDEQEAAAANSLFASLTNANSSSSSGGGSGSDLSKKMDQLGQSVSAISDSFTAFVGEVVRGAIGVGRRMMAMATGGGGAGASGSGASGSGSGAGGGVTVKET